MAPHTQDQVGVELLQPGPGPEHGPGHPQQGAAPAEEALALQGPGGDGLPGQAVAFQDLGGNRLGGGEKGNRGLVALLKLPGHGDAGEQVAAGATCGDYHPELHGVPHLPPPGGHRPLPGPTCVMAYLNLSPWPTAVRAEDH